jgi:hypothetical protein
MVKCDVAILELGGCGVDESDGIGDDSGTESEREGDVEWNPHRVGFLIAFVLFFKTDLVQCS